MNLSKKTLEKLRIIINEESGYRSGPKLVEFFNNLGYDDYYGQGFPSRSYYTDSRLEEINGTDLMEQCIKNIFNPQLFIGKYEELDQMILEFNQYLSYDDYLIKRVDRNIIFTQTNQIFDKTQDTNNDVNKLLIQKISKMESLNLKINKQVLDNIKLRINELMKL